ncbi:MAG TPA: NAD(P)H-quinone oxidoreductase [Bacilli bacterium]
MKAVLLRQPGGPDNMVIGDAPDPEMGEADLLVEVKATALNRADLLQRRGMYPPPEGASPILGLEMAGIVIAAGKRTNGWLPGDRVFALLPGGGYAEKAVVPEGMAMRIPEQLTFAEAAAIPEAFFTAYLNLFELGQAKKGDRVLIHAGASGVGTAAIQLARDSGLHALATAGSERKLAACLALGAARGWNYRKGAFLPELLDFTEGKGVDIVLDFVGAPYFHDHMRALAVGGRLIVIGLLGGGKVDGVDLGQILARRIQIIGTALRSQPLAKKIALTQTFSRSVLPKFASGEIKPVIDSIFDWRDVVKAHERMERNENIGKIILKMDGQ